VRILAVRPSEFEPAQKWLELFAARLIRSPETAAMRFALRKPRPTRDLIWLRDNASRTRRTDDSH
jgi:hypothetical protein